MQNRKGRGLPNRAASRKPSLDLPPSPRRRARLIQIVERFGFLIAFVLTVIALFVFFIGPDLIHPEGDQASGLADAQEGGLPIEGHSGSGGHATQADVSLSITTNPAGAAIYIDGDYAGVSPVRGLAVAQGRRLIAVNKPNYAPLDTVLALNEPATSLTVSLHDGGVILTSAVARTPSKARTTTPSPSKARTTTPSPSKARTTTPSPSASEERQRPSQAAPAPAAEAEPVVQAGELHVVSEPSGASVMMAGREVGVTPLVLPAVQTGLQQVTLRLDGYEDFTKTVSVAAQQRSTVNGHLTPQFGTLKVLVKPWGAIYVDGELRKKEANSSYVATLKPGYHRLRVQHPSLGTWEQVIDVVAGEEHPVTIDFNEVR